MKIFIFYFIGGDVKKIHDCDSLYMFVLCILHFALLYASIVTFMCRNITIQNHGLGYSSSWWESIMISVVACQRRKPARYQPLGKYIQFTKDEGDLLPSL